MARDEHSIFRENLSAYALGALEADELRALEAHLQTCDSCRAELGQYRAISDGLLAALPPRPPLLRCESVCSLICLRPKRRHNRTLRGHLADWHWEAPWPCCS